MLAYGKFYFIFPFKHPSYKCLRKNLSKTLLANILVPMSLKKIGNNSKKKQDWISHKIKLKYLSVLHITKYQ